ncbi:MAG: phosphoribosylglycinamide formyltransferase [Rhodocyclaceae bacterium]|nr:phosphoribosylglycinamide formyltransferase [Rhodocyclaceae bacterium]MBX3668312.1 phosphoribosylglycinamide formyltransferase [Rhodocyclaceae bacterium]
MKKIVILISGRGSNMEALLHAGLPARITGVISNRPDAGGLAIAAAAGVPVRTVDHTQYTTRDAFDAALAQAISECGADLVVLAGFMRILGRQFVETFRGRLLNIHPSLLPAFPGLDTHERALAAGCRLAGATVHFVTPDLDSGPIVIQAAVPVMPDDDAGRLATRVLEQEHRIYPQAVRWFCEDRLQLGEDGRVQLLGMAWSSVACIAPPLECHGA